MINGHRGKQSCVDARSRLNIARNIRAQLQSLHSMPEVPKIREREVPHYYRHAIVVSSNAVSSTPQLMPPSLALRVAGRQLVDSGLT